MKTVLRDDDGMVSHVYNHTFNGVNIYLSKRDSDTVRFELNIEHYVNYFKYHNITELQTQIFKLSNNDINNDSMRYEIADFNELLLDEVKIVKG